LAKAASNAVKRVITPKGEASKPVNPKGGNGKNTISPPLNSLILQIQNPLGGVGGDPLRKYFIYTSAFNSLI